MSYAISYYLAASIVGTTSATGMGLAARTTTEYDSKGACNQAIDREIELIKSTYTDGSRQFMSDRPEVKLNRVNDGAILKVGVVTFIYNCTPKTQ